MIDIDDSARDYFTKLIAQQGVPGLGIRLTAVKPGTLAGDCRLEFCEANEGRPEDFIVDCAAFSVYIDAASAPYLDGVSITYEHQRTGGQLTIRAPKLKGVPGTQASLIERVRHVLESEINPAVAGHGGRVSLVEISAEGEVVLKFGGGCHGCGQVDVTLKHGVEKTLRERIPEITGVRDSTDHASGSSPYYQRVRCSAAKDRGLAKRIVERSIEVIAFRLAMLGLEVGHVACAAGYVTVTRVR